MYRVTNEGRPGAGHKEGWEKMLLTMKNSSPSETKQSFLEDMGTVTSGGKLTQHSKIGSSHQIKYTGSSGIAPWKRKGYP